MKHLLWIMTAILASGTAYAQMPPPPMPRVIAVSGEATEQVAPDQAVLNVSLVSRNADLNAAKQANDKQAETVVALLGEFKIPKEKIAQSYFYISPEYNYENNKQHLVGYIVNRSLRITMDDITIHERVLSALVQAKVDQVGGVEFTMKDREVKAAEVRTKAFENAKAKAMALAKVAGVKLGRPISIDAGAGGAGHPPMPMPMMARSAGMAMSAESVAPSLPGMITLSESVNVTFEME